jgi:site-specific recombinase XerC
MRAGEERRGQEELPRTGEACSPGGIDGTVSAYLAWLERQPLAPATRRAYRTKVIQFATWLGETDLGFGDPLGDPHARDYAVRDFKGHLKQRRYSPSTVNVALAALDNFYRFVGLGSPSVRREELPGQAPRALDGEDQRRFLRAVERRPLARDRAIATVAFFAGLRLAELGALDIDDVAVSARKGQVIVRRGKGDAYREVPLNADARSSVSAWLTERRGWPGAESPALFLSRRGHRLTVRSIDLVIRSIGSEAGLSLSAHVLRHSCLTNLVRAGSDVVLVAEIAGHRRLETTRRYSLPSAADRQAAMEAIRVEY